MDVKEYSVPGMHCGHCQAAVTRELEALEGVERVSVDLDTKLVVVQGRNLEPPALVSAIAQAGYDAAEFVGK